jgi:hypothetical protein
MNTDLPDFHGPELSIDNLRTESQSASSTGSVSGLFTLGGAAAASLIPGIGPFVAVGIGTVGAATTALQLIKKQQADRKIGRIIQDVQTNLADNGLYVGSIDGFFGPDTLNAVVRVQEANDDLEVTGALDDATVKSIVSGSAFSGLDS